MEVAKGDEYTLHSGTSGDYKHYTKAFPRNLAFSSYTASLFVISSLFSVDVIDAILLCIATNASSWQEMLVVVPIGWLAGWLVD